MVILSKHPVFSLLFLVGSFINSAFLLLILECEFLAFLFIIIYVGAIAILFLFSIMMLESKLNNLSKNTIKYIPMGLLFSVTLLLPLSYQIIKNFASLDSSNNFYLNNYQNWFDLTDSINDVEVYGQILYSHFVLHFLIAGLILLLVLIGVVYLTNRYNNKQLKTQFTFKQLSRNFKIFLEN
jgi:NADH-quinone oxidoreductase subunit J